MNDGIASTLSTPTRARIAVDELVPLALSRMKSISDASSPALRHSREYVVRVRTRFGARTRLSAQRPAFLRCAETAHASICLLAAPQLAIRWKRKLAVLGARFSLAPTGV
jgi:hypothetical protein